MKWAWSGEGAKGWVWGGDKAPQQKTPYCQPESDISQVAQHGDQLCMQVIDVLDLLRNSPCKTYIR